MDFWIKSWYCRNPEPDTYCLRKLVFKCLAKRVGLRTLRAYSGHLFSVSWFMMGGVRVARKTRAPVSCESWKKI